MTEGNRLEHQIVMNNLYPARSEDIRALMKDLSLAKAKFTATGKSGNNAHIKQKYALLKDIYNAIVPALAEYNIVAFHYNRVISVGLEYVHTQLFHHPTGQFIEDCRIQESEKPGNQGKGAANTYMKRYALLSLCGIAPDEEDDDGQEEERYIARSYDKYITEDQIRSLQTAIKNCANANTLYNNILRFNKINDLAQLKASSFESVKSYIVNNKE